MKKVLISFLVMTFMIIIADEANAQRRGTKKRRTKEDTTQEDDSKRGTRDRSDEEYGGGSIMDKLNIEIKPGNLFIGNSTSISVKSNVGYKITPTISAGVGGKYFYFWQSTGGGSVSASDYGGFAYAKAKLGREFYIVAEYNVTQIGSFNLTPASSVTYPTAGIGYMRPGLDWSSGFELLFVFSEEARNKLSVPLEYWLNFSYNF